MNMLVNEMIGNKCAGCGKPMCIHPKGDFGNDEHVIIIEANEMTLHDYGYEGYARIGEKKLLFSKMFHVDCYKNDEQSTVPKICIWCHKAIMGDSADGPAHVECFRSNVRFKFKDDVMPGCLGDLCFGEIEMASKYTSCPYVKECLVAFLKMQKKYAIPDPITGADEVYLARQAIFDNEQAIALGDTGEELPEPENCEADGVCEKTEIDNNE